MKKIFHSIVLVSFWGLFSCNSPQNNTKTNNATDTTQKIVSFDATESKKQIAATLDSFNVAAAQSNYEKYFNYYTEDAIFIGTDATENWSKQAFMKWAKPHFDKKKTWNFKALERNIYFSKTGDLAWFDELLDTQMKICRGSGVLIKQGNEWKVQQYVLSMTIPNDKIDPVLKLKASIEDSLIQKLKQK
jgi:ketosteroid isomerase-like protein